MPLHYIFIPTMARISCWKSQKALVEAGANIYAEDEDGDTPFDIADREHQI